MPLHSMVCYFDPSFSPFLLNNICKAVVVTRYKSRPDIYLVSSTCNIFLFEKLCGWKYLCYTVLCCVTHILHYNFFKTCHSMPYHVMTCHLEHAVSILLIARWFLPHARSSDWCETQICQMCDTNVPDVNCILLSNYVYMYISYTVICCAVIM